MGIPRVYWVLSAWFSLFFSLVMIPGHNFNSFSLYLCLYLLYLSASSVSIATSNTVIWNVFYPKFSTLFSPQLCVSSDSYISITDTHPLLKTSFFFFYSVTHFLCYILIITPALVSSFLILITHYGQTEFHNTLLKNFHWFSIIYRIKFQHFRTHKPGKKTVSEY